MKCQKCGLDFPENEIQLSHDVPQYIGGLDADGRHNLCKKCHDIYERMCFAVMANSTPPLVRASMRESARRFASSYFKKEGTDGKSV